MHTDHRVRIEDLLAPLSTFDFLRDYYGHSPVHLPGENDRWLSVFGWAQLNGVLSSHRLSAPQLRVVRAGSAIDEAYYSDALASRRGGSIRRLDAGRVGQALRSGATLVLHALDDLAPSVSDLAYQVEHFLRAPVTVNLYATWGKVEGFNVHWDDHDVFVVQIAGSKRWQVFAPTRPWPTERDAEPAPPPDSPPSAEPVLGPGDVLYLPHGWWHVANAADSPSLHLTIGVRPPSGVDLLDHVVDLLRQFEPARRRLPRFETEASAEEYVAAIADLVDKTLTAQTLRDYLRYIDSQQSNRLAVSLPYSAEDVAGLSVPVDTTLAFTAPTAVIDEFPDKTVLRASARSWTFRPPTVAPLLRHLADVNDFTIGGLSETPTASGLTDAQIAALVGELIRAGLVGVV